MGKVAVVYWSGTGNTEEMAKAVLEGAKLVSDGVIVENAPDDDGVKACEALGEALAKAL